MSNRRGKGSGQHTPNHLYDYSASSQTRDNAKLVSMPSVAVSRMDPARDTSKLPSSPRSDNSRRAQNNFCAVEMNKEADVKMDVLKEEMINLEKSFARELRMKVR